MYTERTSVRVGVCPVRGCAGAGAGEEGRGAGGRLRRRAVGRARFHIVYRPFSLPSRSQQRPLRPAAFYFKPQRAKRVCYTYKIPLVNIKSITPQVLRSSRSNFNNDLIY